MSIIKCLPSGTTGRICLAVSCWMAACVCFWKTSLASHLQGSSTTSTFTSWPGESKFHVSVTDHVDSEKAHRIPPTLRFSNQAANTNTFKDADLKVFYTVNIRLPFCQNNNAVIVKLFYNITPDNCPTNATDNSYSSINITAKSPICCGNPYIKFLRFREHVFLSTFKT